MPVNISPFTKSSNENDPITMMMTHLERQFQHLYSSLELVGLNEEF